MTNQNAMLFVDGAYLQHITRKYGNMRLDYSTLFKKLASQYRLMRTYYFDALPYRSYPPTEEETQRYNLKQRFIDALQYNIDRIKVKLVKIKKTADGFSQKGLDVLMTIEVLKAASAGMPLIILVAGDSDYVPLIEEIRNSQTNVRLVYAEEEGVGAHRDLILAADERVQITQDFLTKFSVDSY